MPQLTEFYYQSSDGVHNIYARQWTPDEPARAVLQIAHGVAEHICRYDPFMKFLAEHGIAVAGNDHLGHGRSVNSDAELGFFAKDEGWDKIVQDTYTLHRRLRSEFPDIPIFLFGHSMGSFVARTFGILHGKDLSGLIICGTGHQPGLMVTGGKTAAALDMRSRGQEHHSSFLNTLAFGSYNKGIKPLRTGSDWLSRDPMVVDAYISDPLCGFIPTAELFHEMMKGIDFVTDRKNIDLMPKYLPVLMISGASDPVGENGRGVIRAYTAFLNAGLENVQLKLYPGARHELLNETNKQQVYDDTLFWINGLC
jgi:alpha-beta hydrolase superfamily lysophospholipase